MTNLEPVNSPRQTVIRRFRVLLAGFLGLATMAALPALHLSEPGRATGSSLVLDHWPPYDDDLYGPHTVQGDPAGEVWFRDAFSIRVVAGAKHYLKVVNPVPDGPGPAGNFSIMLNGVFVVDSAAMAGQTERVIEVPLQAFNNIEVWMSPSGGQLGLMITTDPMTYFAPHPAEIVKPEPGQSEVTTSWQVTVPANAGGDRIMVIDNGDYDRSGRVGAQEWGEIRINGALATTLDTVRLEQSKLVIPVTLPNGTNTIEAMLMNAAPGAHLHVRVMYNDTAKPVLVVSAPANSAVVSSPSVTVSGTYQDPMWGSVNVGSAESYQTVWLGQTPSAQPWSVSHPLNQGSNTIKIWARDGAGNTSDTVTRVVTRQDGGGGGDISVSVEQQNPGVTVERDECLTIAAGDGAAYECGDLRLDYELPATRTMNRERAPTLIYNSSYAGARAIIAADVSVPAGTNATSLEATVLIPGKPNTVRSFVWSSAWSGVGIRRIVVPIDGLALGLPTGAHAYTLQVRAMNGATPLATGSGSGKVVVIDRSGSPYGAGWWVVGLEQLMTISPTEKLWIGGDGSTRFYVQQSEGSTWLATPAVDRPDTLLQVGTGFQRKLRNGTYVEFNALQQHIATVNRQGHRTTFAHGASGIASITLPVPTGSTMSREYTFAYSGVPAILTAVTSPSTPQHARSTAIRHEAGTRDVVRIVEQFSGPDTLFIAFRYDASRRIDGRQNRRGDMTSFAYDEAGLLRQASVDMSRNAQPAIVTTFCAAESRSVASCASGPQLLPSVYTLLDGPRTDVQDTAVFFVTRFGAPREIRNALGHLTTIERSDARFPILPTAVVQPNGFRTEAFFNARGLLDSTRAVNPIGTGQNAITQYAWDSKWDMVVRTTLPTGERDSIIYDPATGNRLSQQDGRGSMSRTTFSYDAHNRVEFIQSPGNSVAQRERIEYDTALGNARKLTTPLGFASEMFSDAIGRDTLTKTPFDSLQQTFRTLKTEYDPMGRPVLVNDGPGLSVHTRFDQEGLPVAIGRWSTPDPAGILEIRDTLIYDAAGRKSESRDSYRAGVFDLWTYDPAGNLLSHRMRNGESMEMTYDALGRLRTRRVTGTGTEKTSVPADTLRFDYDLLGNITVADNRFARVRRSYYPGGALDTDTLRINTSNITTNDYEQHVYGLKSFYDLSGRRLALKHPANIALGGDSVAYRYDALTGLLASVRDVNGAEYHFAYDSAQRPVRTAMPGNIVDTTIYDADSRVRRRIEEHRIAPIVEIHRDSFALDASGRVLMAATKNPLHFGGFEYTLLGAVRLASEAVEQSQSFSIDAFGNRASYRRWTDESVANYTHVYEPHSTRLTRVGGAFTGGEQAARDTLTQGYDLAGNLTGVTHNSWVDKRQPGDVGPRWEITSFSTTRNRYASDGRLALADRNTSEDVDRTDHLSLQTNGYEHLVSNAGLGRGVYEEYRYDALGRRVWVRAHREPYCDADDRTRNTDCLGAVQRIVWDGDQVLYEIRQEAQDATPATTLELDRSALYPGRAGHFGITGYTHGPTIDRPLSMRRDLGSSDAGLKQLTLHRDWRGMISTSTYAIGPDSGKRAECAFTGETPVCLRVNWPATNHTVSRARSMNDSGPPSWYGTLSQDYRDATGTLYKRNRTYDPVTGRFTQEDPIGLTGGLNLYGFADGDPVNFSDPFGLCPVCIPLVAGIAEGTGASVGVGAAAAAAVAGMIIATRGADAIGAAVGDAADALRDKAQVKFVTYTRSNLATGQVYSGRSSGFGSPQAIVNARAARHSGRLSGFGPAVVDRWASGAQGYAAIRGREQQLIDANGGAQSDAGTSANLIRGVSRSNPFRDLYDRASSTMFGRIY